MRTPIVPEKFDPKMMDPAMDEIKDALKLNLSWLDNTYGKVETLIEGKGREKKTFPAVYVGTKKDRGYLKLLPDSHIGNFSYIEVSKQSMEEYPGQFTDHTADISIVFWFNYEKVYPDDHKLRTLENVKSDVFDMLSRYAFTTCHLKFESFVEGANDIYRGFTHEEIKNQFLMRPYGGFKISGKIRFSEQCNPTPTTIVSLPPAPEASSLVMYSLTEAKTGMKDYDDRDIYVRGYVLTPQDFVFFNNFTGYVSDLNPSEVGRIVDWNLKYSIGQMGWDEVIKIGSGQNGHLGLLYNNTNGTNTPEYHIEIQSPVSGTWFIYYTKS